jgi:hypothetical protein
MTATAAITPSLAIEDSDVRPFRDATLIFMGSSFFKTS